jgi:hypothetical protein
VKMLDYEVIQRMTEIIMEYENRIKTLEGWIIWLISF